jgi:uncharacterized repeat protein (TIGR01451 family)
LRYTVTISDTGTSNTVVFADAIPDPNTTLVAGSVTTSQGSVISGNTAGDTVVGVNVGTINNSSATITFDVTIKNPLPVGVNIVGDQGGVSCDVCGGGIPTDDPGTATANDPTLVAVAALPNVTATKQVAPTGLVKGGDTLTYTVVITNNGNQDAGGVTLADPPPAGSTLVVGSVTTSAGVVLSGNNTGDTAVVVQIPTLAGGGGNATITFQAQVNTVTAGAAVTLANQGTVSGANFPPTVTDDPGTAAANDPTVNFAVGAAPAPALDNIGLLLSIIVLAGVAALGMRRVAGDRLKE